MGNTVLLTQLEQDKQPTDLRDWAQKSIAPPIRWAVHVSKENKTVAPHVSLKLFLL